MLHARRGLIRALDCFGFGKSKMTNRLISIVCLLAFALLASSCEIDTSLKIYGGNPPKFSMTGSGSLGRLRIRGHEKQREAFGEDASIYWQIEPKDSIKNVWRVSPITYGVVPEGYEQIYPENGKAPPPLVAGQRYYVRIDTNNANGSQMYFIIRNGEVKYSEYEYDLPED